MGRKKLIDRDAVLNAAEEILRTQGAAALTIDAVAKAMEITKGGVQYCFGNKEGMVKALLDRWCAEYEKKMQEVLGGKEDSESMIWGNLEVSQELSHTLDSKAASVLAVIYQSPNERKQLQEWYNEMLSGLDTRTERGRLARLAFYAGEGIFALRSLGLVQVSSEEWREILSDILALRTKDNNE